MRLIIIGKNGQLGRELFKISKLNGYDVTGFGKKELNILNYETVNKIIGKLKPDVVINTAAYHVASDCELYPEKAFALNSAAEKNLADACRNAKSVLVYISTDRVFNGQKGKPYKETDTPGPIQAYGLSKYAGEVLSTTYNKKSIIIRTCGMFGGLTGSREKKGNFVLYILNEAKKKKELDVSSEQIASFVSAEDLAFAIVKLLKKRIKSGVFHIVNKDYASWADFDKEIVKIRKLNLKILPVNRKGSYQDIPIPKFTALDTSKIESFGIHLPGWKTALKKYLDYLSRHGK
jgi:dTDP-4-dehydrorhamnose reductase